MGVCISILELSGTLQEKLKSAPNSCLPESSMSDADFMREGVLHKHAARILMRCLWLSWLARPDISFVVGRLTTRVSKWTAWEDRQTLRLICYLNSTRNHVFRGSVDHNEKHEK